MLPQISGIKVYTIVYVASMIVHAALAVWYCRRQRLSARWGLALGVCYTWGMVVGARILYDIRYQQLDISNYLTIGYYFKEGIWGGPLAYLAASLCLIFVIARSRRLELLDITALALPIPMILAKVACFFNSCCYGAPSAVPWAVSFPEGGPDYGAPPGVYRHPTQLYEIAGLAAILGVFALLNRNRWRGTLLLWFTVIYGISRPLSEVFRADVERDGGIGPFTASQLTCLVSAIISMSVLLLVRISQQRRLEQTAA